MLYIIYIMPYLKDFINANLFVNKVITMLSIKVKFRPSSIVGREGSLYYQIIYKRIVRQVSTSHHIFADEWDEGAGCIRLNYSVNKRTNHLLAINKEINWEINRYQNVYSRLKSSYNDLNIDVIINEVKKHRPNLLFVYMEQIISHCLKQGKLRTSETYSTTLNSFRSFRGDIDIDIADINREILMEYESFLENKNLAPNTISFYMKHLRAVYNRAVEDELIIDKHPFKRVNTSISSTPKRAVSLNTIKLIKRMDLSNSPIKRFARDIFLFSFYTRGMSFVDIAFLEKRNLRNNIICYRRKKTNQLIEIRLESCMQDIINMYISNASSPFLFGILNHDTRDYRKQYQTCMTKINRHLKCIGRELGLSHPLTMYCARHSWASIARAEGVSISVISEGMGHDSEKTTQIYLASIKSEVIDKANKKIIRLLK